MKTRKETKNRKLQEVARRVRLMKTKLRVLDARIADYQETINVIKSLLKICGVK